MKRLLVSGLLVLLFASMIFTTPSRASVVWSDNFDDGNLDGWTTSGVSWYFGRTLSTLADANFSAADKTLRMTGVEKFRDYSIAMHPTGTTTGTWSWDLYFNPKGTIGGYTGMIDWIDKPTFIQPQNDWNGYGIDVTDMGTITLLQYTNGYTLDLSITYRSSFNSHPGTWTHFDVTHDSDGRWRLYANGTLAMDIVDKKFSDFGYFGFWLCPGLAIDNVVVSDTIYVPPGSLRISVKDSTGNALSGAAVSSTKQPSGQTALSGTTATDGTVTFTGLAVGNYSLQVSKDGYVASSAQGAVASGAKTELSSTLQAQPSSGIPGFPIASVVIGVLLCTAWYWMYAHLLRLGGV